jgi:peptidoglycan/xylan/chitin deacetylase (PgdA/CDA1 family)
LTDTIKALFSSVLSKSGTTKLLDAAWGGQRLTVLAYHRITDAMAPGFDHYRKNVSATPEMFERQLAYVTKHFNVIDLFALEAFIKQNTPLPERPLLITFDDGYLDNYSNAFPILRRFDLPAVIFLITGQMDNPALPWWDACAYYFYHTPCASAVLPFLGEHDLSSQNSRDLAREEMIRKLKQLPENEKQATLISLSQALEVASPPTAPFVSWEQVRELVDHRVACQPHTVTHPILTRIAPQEVSYQLTESRARIEAETKQRGIAFAYPNGTMADYDSATIAALRECGYEMAFTLSPGPMPLNEVKRTPLTIRRAALQYKDTFDMFVAKLMGVPALLGTRNR